MGTLFADIGAFGVLGCFGDAGAFLGWGFGGCVGGGEAAFAGSGGLGGVFCV